MNLQIRLILFFLLIQVHVSFSQKKDAVATKVKEESCEKKIVFWKTSTHAKGLTAIDSIADKERNQLFHSPLFYGRHIYFLKKGDKYDPICIIRDYVLDYLKESKGALDSIVDYLKINNTKKISITGHVSPGKDAMEIKYEQRASEALAEILKEYLVKHKIAAERIKTSGVGSSGLLYENEPDKVLTPITIINRNNRVEIKVLP